MVTPDPLLVCPFDLQVATIPRLLNGELVDDPVYEGFELQWFDDPVRGAGLLAFLQRRADHLVDYYLAPGLTLDPDDYRIGAGIGHWGVTTFAADHLEVTLEGVVADVRFTDVEGREIRIAVDDRAAGPRRTGELLAPVGAGIEHPTALMLVWLHGFDLLRDVAPAPEVRIDGEVVDIGSLPGHRLHRRHLIKAAAPLTVASLCRAGTRELTPIDRERPGHVHLDGHRRGIRGLDVEVDGATAGLRLDPPFPALDELVEGTPSTGKWEVRVDDATMTGGTWQARRTGNRVELALEVTRRWRPPRSVPLLLWTVTRLIPVFRRWPTTYRWHADIALGDPPRITSTWTRTGTDRGERYRQATRS